MKNANIVSILNITSDCMMVAVGKVWTSDLNIDPKLTDRNYELAVSEASAIVCLPERDWLLQSPGLLPCDQNREQFPEITELLMKSAIKGDYCDVLMQGSQGR